MMIKLLNDSLTVKVIEQLESYLPVPQRPIPVHGDGASVLSMVKVQKIRQCSDEEDRHTNIVPVMGEFHDGWFTYKMFMT